jgi:hypothetical protein
MPIEKQPAKVRIRLSSSIRRALQAPVPLLLPSTLLAQKNAPPTISGIGHREKPTPMKRGIFLAPAPSPKYHQNNFLRFSASISVGLAVTNSQGLRSYS